MNNDFIKGLGRDQINVLVAHDWGGAVAYAFCGRWPQMVGRYVALNIPHPSSVHLLSFITNDRIISNPFSLVLLKRWFQFC